MHLLKPLKSVYNDARKSLKNKVEEILKQAEIQLYFPSRQTKNSMITYHLLLFDFLAKIRPVLLTLNWRGQQCRESFLFSL